MGRSDRLCDFDVIFSTIRNRSMAVSDVHAIIAQVLVIAWIYRLCLNPDWLWTVGTSAGAKYRLQGYAFCSTGAHIRYGDLSAVHRRGGDMVEDASDDAHFIWIDIGKCEDGPRQEVCSRIVVNNL